jgi:hypothetical protein
MNDELKHATAEISRRSALRKVAAYVTTTAAISAMGTKAALAGKFAQQAVFYRPSPSLGQKCSNCILFERPRSCKSVAGVISPNGWCVIWKQ